MLLRKTSLVECFWKTVWHLRKGKRNIQAVYIRDGTLFTSNEKVIGW